MIEFKADCGHTIRAKDGDEGKVVRCSYCGRTTQVPDKAEDEFASLFSDVADLEAGESVSAGETVKPRRRRPAGAPKPGRPARSSDSAGSFNPFAVVVKMAYAAVIVIVLIVCAKFGYNYLTADRPATKPTPTRTKDHEAHAGEGRPGARKPKLASGPAVKLPNLKSNQGGLYLTSFPKGAQVRYRQADVDHDEAEIFRDSNAQRCQTPCKLELNPGLYEVAVALRIDSPELTRYRGYQDQRRAAEESGSEGYLASYFLPDDAEEFSLVALSRGRTLVVRTYECEVFRGEWELMTALFLPDVPISEQLPYLPTTPSYGFKENYVRSQLSYHRVPELDHTYIINALGKVGMVVYKFEDGEEYRAFRIERDGSLGIWPCEDRRF